MELSSIDMPSMPYAQDDNVFTLDVKNNPIITHPEPIGSELSIG
jgi:hypothetical protein